ncbi:MAG: myo-inositol 2-dehydrogenase / D-chiro-inositol 1-dehydrogenase [Chloroflexota bacterium]|nr:myo-inositol 2-dehydrogenase / D-chiro-inositol 1-dehydrogenase [Chloroflexota bacterium]
MAVFNLGLVGAGRMGQNHLKAIAASEAVKVVAIAEPSGATRATLAKSGAVLHPDIDSMLVAGGLDGVLVCAPSDQHLVTVRRLVAAGLPILCEKPLGVIAQEAREAAKLAAEASLPLQIGFWRRFVPMLKRLKERIDAGELGDIYAIACFQWDGQPPGAYFRTHSGGIFVDMGVHEFDQARWLSGQEFVSSTALASGVADEPWPGDPESAHALAELSRGATAVISLGRRFPLGDVCKVEVFGTKGWEECRFLWPPTADDTFFEALKVQAESFARYARGGPREGAGGEDAVAALEASVRAASSMAGAGAA